MYIKKEIPNEVLQNILNLEQKLALDGVQVSSPKTIEMGLNLDLDQSELGPLPFFGRKIYPSPGELVMHNPYAKEKSVLKKKGASPKKKRR